jgi:hypothetical protein
MALSLREAQARQRAMEAHIREDDAAAEERALLAPDEAECRWRRWREAEASITTRTQEGTAWHAR